MDEINYIEIENGEFKENSYNGILKKLITEVRKLYNEVPVEEIGEHLPRLNDMESILKDCDKEIGDPEREYIKEIWSFIDSES